MTYCIARFRRGRPQCARRSLCRLLQQQPAVSGRAAGAGRADGPRAVEALHPPRGVRPELQRGLGRRRHRRLSASRPLRGIYLFIFEIRTNSTQREVQNKLQSEQVNKQTKKYRNSEHILSIIIYSTKKLKLSTYWQHVSTTPPFADNPNLQSVNSIILF